MDTKRSKEIAVRAAREAGQFIRERVAQRKQIDYKSAFNIVTDVDKGSEAMIIKIIRDAFPDDSILAEESGSLPKQGERRWLIDPLDGTTNFAHSYPFFCVSIALEFDGELMVGAVFNPMTQELFCAEKGNGAYLNDERIHVSAIDKLSASLLATGFPPDSANAAFNNMEAFANITAQCHGVRRDGSAALDLCFVACGRSEGFWEWKLAPWDMGAGALIVREAGGKVTNLVDGPLDLNIGHILATNGVIHSEVVQELGKYLTPAAKK